MRKILLTAGLLLLLACRCFADGGYIALTFDDGPTGKYTQRMLEILAQEDVKATFFLCGYRVEQYPQLTAQLAQGGHELGLHGCTHHFFTDMTEAELARELTGECYLIAEITGVAPYLLRPPGGLTQTDLSDSIEGQFPVILWSVDPQDWATDSRRTITRRVTKAVKDGDIILLHDASASSVEAAGDIIRSLKARGFTFLTVSQLAAQFRTPLVGGERYYRFCD